MGRRSAATSGVDGEASIFSHAGLRCLLSHEFATRPRTDHKVYRVQLSTRDHQGQTWVDQLAQERIHLIWDTLSDFEARQTEQAADFLMGALCELSGAWNSTWAGAVRLDGSGRKDPLQGWRVGAVQALVPIVPAPDEQHFRDILKVWERREIDPSFLLPMRDVGTFRTYSFRRELAPDWFGSPFFERHYGRVGIHDAVFVAFPINEDCESHFGFYSGEVFSDVAIARLTYALRGIKWFQRRMMLGHGLLTASAPLTPMERRILQLLLTEASEKEIGRLLDIAPSTAHQHVTSVFRKFGVRSRAGLMSVWLNRPHGKSPTPRNA
ncbi:MAG: helix-turn-helix transcriptional regulator [Rhizobiales bacterium]|nr:helix-turn-helix transcriptional regulator [Hyphomicrobiales bacterium]